MNYTENVFELLGVKPYEAFKLNFYDNYFNQKYQDTLFQLDEDLDILAKSKGDALFCRSLSGVTIKNLLKGTFGIIKIPSLEEEQIAVDYARLGGFKWIAKDKDDSVHAFDVKPKKNVRGGCWCALTNRAKATVMRIIVPISFISWEDDEPYCILVSTEVSENG